MNEKILSSHEFAKAMAEALKGNTSKRLTIDDCKVFQKTMIEVIRDLIVEGYKVRLHGFADFYGVEKEAGEGRDPRTGETIAVPQRLIFKMKASRAMKEAVRAAYNSK